MKGLGIIDAYHARRVAPLMACTLPLYQMVPRAPFKGTVLADEALRPSEVAQRIKEAMEPMKDSIGAVLDFVYPVSGHPQMWPESGFVEFVSFLSPCFSFHLNFQPPDANLGIAGLAGGLFFKDSLASLPKDPTRTAANRAVAGWDKKTKELMKKKAMRKQQARDRGEETGSEDDDDDDDDDDEVAANMNWDVLEDEDMLTSARPSM